MQNTKEDQAIDNRAKLNLKWMYLKFVFIFQNNLSVHIIRNINNIQN